MARFSKTEMKKLCDYVGCDSNGKADEMKFNVLLKIYASDPDDDDENDDDDNSGEEKAEKDDTVWIEVNYIGSLYSAQMVQCKTSDSVLDLKEKLTDFNDIGVDQQKIIFKNKDDTDKAIVLGDDITVGEILVKAGEKESCRLQLICSLEGGGKISILSWKSCSINLSFFM